jgi:GNAT superfamily N-acetyltransferase
MALWTWWRGDTLPQLEPIDGFRGQVSNDIRELALLMGLNESEVADRLEGGHRAHVAYVDGAPAAYGWVATLAASIGELKVRFDLTSGDRYLWDFATLPEWRGRGIYPRLLQSIIRQEDTTVQRYWVINAPENYASESGIRKAGFTPVSDLSFLRNFSAGAVPYRSIERAKIGAAVLGVELVESVNSGRVLAPCWRCVIASSEQDSTHIPCWSPGSTDHHCECVMGSLPQT